MVAILIIQILTLIVWYLCSNIQLNNRALSSHNKNRHRIQHWVTTTKIIRNNCNNSNLSLLILTNKLTHICPTLKISLLTILGTLMHKTNIACKIRRVSLQKVNLAFIHLLLSTSADLQMMIQRLM